MEDMEIRDKSENLKLPSKDCPKMKAVKSRLEDHGRRSWVSGGSMDLTM
jgi:hypothetical protein